MMSRPSLGRAARGLPGRLERTSRAARSSQDQAWMGDREGSPLTARPSWVPKCAPRPWNRWSQHSRPGRDAPPLTPLRIPDKGTVAEHAGPSGVCCSLRGNSHLVPLAGKLSLGTLLNPPPPPAPAPTTTDAPAQSGLERPQDSGFQGFRPRVTTGAL